MKKILLLSVLALSVIMFGCSSDPDPGPTPTGNSKIYTLGSVAVQGISGTAEFIENDDASVTITITLSNTPQGGVHPAHIHANTAAEGGSIVLSLGSVDGTTGEGSVTITTLDDGTPISYNDLLNFDGYINVHESENNLATLVAQGDIGQNELTGTSKTYTLSEKAVADIEGTVTFAERVNGEALATITLQNTPAGGSHPAHIHTNAAIQGGSIAFSFNPVDGDNGISKTNVSQLDDGTAFGYSDVLGFDGYVNVHLSDSELSTLVAQGDIGTNELTGISESYDLSSVADPNISGTVTFEQRVSGEALAVIELTNTPVGGSHPAHIHADNAATGGGIVFSFNPVDGTTGISFTHVNQLDDGSPFLYADVADFDGYVNVHLSSSELSTLVAQGDIGQNELTGDSKSYTLNTLAVPGIDGMVTFEERRNGEALAIIMLNNTPADGVHPAHIHNNTAVEGGGIAFTFNSVDGNTGMSKTNVSQLNDGTAFGYNEVLDYNGYINVHLSANELSTIVAQGDIGQNELSGESTVYELAERAVAGISGTATFAERLNGTTLITIDLTGTPDGGEHPAHIHANDAATGGGIVLTLTSVDGTTGMSKTQVSQLNDGTVVSYSDLIDYNGYINVHLSPSELGTIVAQGNIGSNANQGTTINYDVTNSGSSAYLFTGNGLTNESNPTLTLTRGETYTFTVNATGHPFLIKTEQTTGTANMYNTGVTNNGTASGTVTFTVPNDAPSTLFYICQIHAGMTGTINIVD